jgi:hypothetical protein
MSKLQEAGLDEAFMRALEKDPELTRALDKLGSPAASAGWSCCVTVSNPLLTGREMVINPPMER